MRRGVILLVLFFSLAAGSFWGLDGEPAYAEAASLPDTVKDPANSLPDMTAAPAVTEKPSVSLPPHVTILPEATNAPVASATAKPGDTATDADFGISGGRLNSYHGHAAEVRIPSTVKTIGSMAFSSNMELRAVTIPSTVKRVESGAFYNCPYLRYIHFEGNTAVKKYAVYNCVRFTNISAKKGKKPYKFAVKYKIPVAVTTKRKLAVAQTVLLAGDKEDNFIYNNYQPVRWNSSRKDVASVSANGVIKGVKAGKAKVTATIGGETFACQVTILNRTSKNRVKQVCQSIIKKKMSRYQKIKAVHDWLVVHVKYDYDGYLRGYVPMVCHSARGALLNGLAVCDGYAHAFRMFMRHLKIPCRFVVGRSGKVGHAWNLVKLKGKWYHVDVTFDDPIVNESNENTKPYYHYFLKSTKKMRRSHVWKTGKYPKCTSTKYD